MKLKVFVFIVSISLATAIDAQTPEKKLVATNGDEQGLEVPKSLVLQQDKDAYSEALKGWYTKDKNEHPHRADWFADAHFGCFVHWGVYSTLAGEWKGVGSLGYGEHIMRSRTIPLAEYKEKVVATFNPFLFNADEWMKNAKEAGMKYFIITAKHHDGFAMYPSKAYPYDIRQTKMQQDPMMALSIAAKKYGIKFGFYYSHAFDWEHPDAPGNDWDYNNPGGDKLLHGSNWWESYPAFLPNAEKYVNQKSIPQILELINNYHPDILWFDTPHKLPMYLNLKIIKTIRDADPSIVVNGRLARVGNINFGDYANTGDRAAFFRNTLGVWEAIPTTNESYGYNKFDSSHKTPQHFVRLLASAAAKGGNILLNVGPKGDGTIDTKDVAILKNVGKWMKANSESIYGTTRNPIALQSWGEITQKGNALYLHVYQWPKDGKLVVGGLEVPISKAFFLTQPKNTLTFKKINETDLAFTLPSSMPDTLNTVIKVLFTGNFPTPTTRLISAKDDNTLLVFDAATPGKTFSYGDGKNKRQFATNWKNKDQYLQWNVRLNETANFIASIAYNTDAKDEDGEVVLEVDGNKFPLPYKATNKSNMLVLTPSVNVNLEKGEHTFKLLLNNFKGKQAMQPLHLQLIPSNR